MLQFDPNIDNSLCSSSDAHGSDRDAIAEDLVAGVIELNIARKNSVAYPLGHVQLDRSMRRACTKVQKVLVQLGELTLQVKRDRLLWQECPLSAKNDAVAEYAEALYQMGIHTVTFLQDFNEKDLNRFHQLLAMTPETILNAGGIQKIFAEAGFDTIRIQEIDYTSYRTTEESGHQKQSADANNGEEGTGFRFIKKFFSKLVPKFASNASGLDNAATRAPKQMAQLLNEGRFETPEVLASYDQFLTEQMVAMQDPSDNVQRKEALLEDLDTLLKNLKPGLKRQFLSITFNRLGDVNDSETKESILGGLSDEMVIEMLRLANEENKEISPALIRLVQKMSGVRNSGPDAGQADDRPPEMGDAVSTLSAADMKQLFEREKYERYVDAEYDSLLKRLSDGSKSAANRLDAFDLKKLIRTFREDHIERQLNQLLISILDEESDPEVYRTFSQTLLSRVSNLLDRGEFRFLLNIIAAFNRHQSDNPIKKIRHLAERSLGILQTPQFLSEAAAAFEKWSGEKKFEIGDLYLAIGTRRVSKLIDLYGRNAYRGDLDALLSVLAGFGPVVLDEVYSRLNDPRSEYVLNMLYLIGAIGNRQSLAHLKTLLAHEDLTVRFAALEIFLKFKDPQGIKALKSALRSESPREFSLAVALAGDYRVAGLVPDLLAMIKTKPLRKSDFELNEILVSALGKIGHVAAIPTLEILVQSKWSLQPNRLSQMKEVVYASLDRYPYDSIRVLIMNGEKSDNPRIQQLCADIVGRQFHSQLI